MKRNRKQTQDGSSKPEPQTLPEFLALDGAPVRPFVRALQKSSFQQQEKGLDEALDMVRSDPGRVDKVLEIARAIRDENGLPVSLLRWCGDVIRIQDESLADWGRNPAESPTEALRQLLAWADGRSREVSASRDQSKDKCLAIGLVILFTGRSLSPLDILRILAGDRYGRDHSNSTEQSVAKLLVGANRKKLDEFAAVAALAEAEIQASGIARDRAIRATEHLAREKIAAENTSNELVAKVESLERTVAERDRTIEDLRADAELVWRGSAHREAEVKARIRHMLEERLSVLLNDAWDAIDTQPPHPDIALQRIKSARTVIERELRWLNESSA